MRFLIALALALTASSALAQMRIDTPDDSTLFIELPHGEVLVTMNTVEGYGLFVHAGGDQEVLLESAHMPEWLEVYGNSALLRLHMGTAQCEALFAWVTYDANGLRASDVFGTCAYEGDYAASEGGATYTMDAMTNGGTPVTYVLDSLSGQVSEL